MVGWIRCAEGHFREASHGHDDLEWDCWSDINVGFCICHSNCCASTEYSEWITPFFPRPFVSSVVDVCFGIWCFVFGVRLQTLFCC